VATSVLTRGAIWSAIGSPKRSAPLYPNVRRQKGRSRQERVINGLMAQLIIQDREAKTASMGNSSAQAASLNERVLFHHLESFVRLAVILFVDAFLPDHDSWAFPNFRTRSPARQVTIRP
jgi:hypothetical protein